MSRLHDLHDEQGQSPWLDNLRRDWIHDGELQRWVDRGVRGITSNPTIFQKAIAGGDAYDEQFRRSSPRALGRRRYWELVVTRHPRRPRPCCGPVHDASDGVDGYVSVEVAPVARPRHRRHRRRGPAPPRPHRRAEPLRQDPGHGRGPSRHRADDHRGQQRQRHPALLLERYERGHRGLPLRPRGRRRRPRRRSPRWPRSS